MAEGCTIVYIHHIFIRSHVDAQLGYFQILATVNNAAMNIGVYICFQISVSLTPIRQTIIVSKRQEITSVGEDVEKRESSYAVGRNVNWCSHCGK